MTKLDDLIERLEKAEGPDSQLSRQIIEALGAKCRCFDVGDGDPLYWWEWPDTSEKIDAEVTASVDSTLSLVERVLPEAMWATGRMEEGPFCRLVVPVKDGGYCPFERTARTPALAILLALLHALKGSDHDRD